jgi:hypothetical protein
VQQIRPRRNGSTMPTTTPRVRLRNALRKLRGIESRLAPGFSPGETGQEMLDFLAMADGLKPVYLLGRGLADPIWIAGVLKVARDMKLRAVEGPFWDADPLGKDFPDWYTAHCEAELAPFRAHYICRAAATEAAVRRVCETGRPSMEEEARLLGYPECCVAAHYARARAFHRATLAMLSRMAGGDEAEMRRLLAADVALVPETAEERAALQAGVSVVPAPYASFNMCDACRADPGSPAARLSARYVRLAREVDPALAQRIGLPPPVG